MLWYIFLQTSAVNARMATNAIAAFVLFTAAHQTVVDAEQVHWHARKVVEVNPLNFCDLKVKVDFYF